MDTLDLLKLKKWAVVGATVNEEKYGNMIYKKLKAKGYDVYAVNPRYEEVDGDKCYPDIRSLPVVPDVIDMVVAPKFGIETMKEAKEEGVKNVWLQPGTESEEILNYAKDNGINAVEACVLVALNYK
jgi:predicted CoA-binding protein